MKICPQCSTQVEDDGQFCPACGTLVPNAGTAPAPEAAAVPVAAAASAPAAGPAEKPMSAAAPQPQVSYAPPQAPYGQPQPQSQPVYAQPVMPYDPADHTAEFDPKDIADNKLFALSSYILGFVGIVVALLAAKDSPFAMFHVRNALKLTVAESLIGILTLFLFWTILVPIAGSVLFLILVVIEVICFVQACQGKAKDPAIIRSIGFLK